MNSYYSMEMAAEVRAQQLLAEAERRSLVRSIVSGHGHRSPSASMGVWVTAVFHRLVGRFAGVTPGKTAVQGR
jgi:hypothetical protein